MFRLRPVRHIAIKSLNPDDGTPFTYWWKLSEYLNKVICMVYTALLFTGAFRTRIEVTINVNNNSIQN